MLKLLRKQANNITYIYDPEDIPLKDLSLKIALTSLRLNGYYAYKKDEQNNLLIWKGE